VRNVTETHIQIDLALQSIVRFWLCIAVEEQTPKDIIRGGRSHFDTDTCEPVVGYDASRMVSNQIWDSNQQPFWHKPSAKHSATRALFPPPLYTEISKRDAFNMRWIQSAIKAKLKETFPL
jgi:hypothetical protein